MIKNDTTYTRSLTLKAGPTTLAVALCATLMAPQAHADNSNSDSTEIDKVTVEESVSRDSNPYAVPGASYLAERVSDPRRTRSLAKTPQTITVLTAEAIQESGRTDLRDILDGQPGITLGTGENGNAFGDRYIIRGHEARSDMFVDGLRDPGMTIRESFAVDQIEISKGPSSTFAGRGTTGGAVNAATKRATTEHDFNKISAGTGTDSYHRLTADINKAISDDTAIRINVLDAHEDVPDRAPAERDRKGVAVSVFHQATDDLEITADYYHFEGNDKPDLGTYLTDADGDGMRNDPVKGIPVYLQKEDFLQSTVDTFTLRAGYEISPETRLVNLTRYGTTDNGYLVTGAKGATGYATEDDANNGVNGFDTISLSTHQGWQEVEYFANQLNLMHLLELGGMTHELVLGGEYSRQQVINGVYGTSPTGTKNCWSVGRSGVSEGYCGLDTNGRAVANLNNLLQRNVYKGDADSDWNLDTISVYAMDTVDITDNFTLSGGMRYDHYDYELALPDKGAPGTFLTHEYKDGVWSGHVGLSYDITPTGNIYASFSTATNLNGGESDVGTNGGYGGFIDAGDADAGPEKTKSYEVGTKWLLGNSKLLASAALFRIDKSDVMESQSGGYEALGTANTGANRVQGVELGLSGNLTDELSIQAGLAIMNAEVTKSYNPQNVGKTLANFADKSFNLQAKYQLTPKFSFGGAVTYESERYAGQPDAAANEKMEIPAYTVLDAFATYQVNSDLSLRVNVNNVTDKDYYLSAYRSGSFTYIGDKRNAQVTVNYKF
ncbi:TonB-dependent siderophore receptor [Sulfurovum sp.]|jgi:catecholate siderophore receptor|uniref:TonB-dependent receptor n=1 Tax=Sulfurovum sp. TaxID=1969726 RepID=UPI002A3704CC|nr:TonB-dependent siderophore receptor [Sulfurovum sp.]MDD2450801.1 TonB-dependent siderophore receptor [Sulfurovum sp.]MDD3499119.1 TonB-dependent siderophore receptor [Sulfurovum sp.]MDY0402189.1 TonB-dependent siderophore receptor [Sulfurovum sp.]